MARTPASRPTRPPPSRNLRLRLPEDLHRALARAAIREWLEARRREAVSKRLAAYAHALAGSVADLDGALERAAVDRLRKPPGAVLACEEEGDPPRRPERRSG